MPLRVAVVGSGISGLAAAWLLARDPARFDVVLIEQSPSAPGGHANTVDVPAQDGSASKVGVDSGFIVCNPVTYPNFIALLDHLGVPLVRSDMSFAVSRNHGAFEWAGHSLRSLFAQPLNILPWSQPEGGIYRLVWDTLRFHAHAASLADEADALVFDHNGRVRSETAPSDFAAHPLATQTLGAFFAAHNYSAFFYENYVLPMTASIWSTPADLTFDKFPVLSLVRFMRNHLMLQIGNRPKWRTVSGGSRTYTQKIVAGLPDVRLGKKIVAVKRPDHPDAPGPVTLIDANGVHDTFDHVIFATHSDQTLDILGDSATPDERKILGAIKYTKNRAVLHRDPSLMPKRRAAWASWNYLTTSGSESKSDIMCLTYWMNRLQPFINASTYGNVFVTLNPMTDPAADTILGEWMYDHPVYTPETIASQESLNRIQNKHATTFCGAWTNYGFHEDGCTSGLLAAISIGATCPFDVCLNGGYPTARVPPPPPVHLAKTRGVKQYTPPPPSPKRVLHLRAHAANSLHHAIRNSLIVVFILVVCAVFVNYAGVVLDGLSA